MEKIPNIEEWKMRDRELEDIKRRAGLIKENVDASGVAAQLLQDLMAGRHDAMAHAMDTLTPRGALAVGINLAQLAHSLEEKDEVIELARRLQEM